MRMCRSLCWLLVCLLFALPPACGKSGGGAAGSGGAGGESSETGGGPGGGGASETGGASAAGGDSGSGGRTVSGGAMGSGGATSAGGATGNGGATGSGGATGGGAAVTDAGPPVATSGCGAPLPAACNNTTTGSCKLDVNGKTREYFVVLPTEYDNSTPAPVVFAYHGLGGTAASLLPTGSGRGGYALYGVQPGLPNAVFVVPQGLAGSDGGTDYGWPNTGGQDIDFVRAMLTWLETNLCVDKARYFSTGMSYGGMMSENIACQLPDLFRAIGSMAGSLFSTRNCVEKPIAAWITHGDADTTVQISGDITARDMIIAHNGCDTTNTSTVTLTDRTYGDVTCTVYDQCTAGNYPVIWCPVVGMGHAIPSFAGTEIAKFFAQF
ncbi:MAG: prolyl oligopeptidase family serine peptidase [Deltaproteobacteria bacterium]|nr:prolyl oligopeptidase family serine peptidase [Deltaproteobacteria bacterium]